MVGSRDGLAIETGRTVVFIGDSITDCGRRGEFIPFGNGYVSMAIALIAGKYPERRIRFVNEGIGGDVATALRDRWADDVLVHEADWVSVMVGINDLHRTMRGAEDAVPPELYREAYDDFLTRTVEAGSPQLIVMDPFYMSRETHETSVRSRVLALLPQYQAVVAEMAQKYSARHVKLHEMFARVLEHYPSDLVCPEPVHPNTTGHLMIAHKWLESVDW